MADIPTNVELKARCADPGKARQILEQLGAERLGAEEQVDTYFSVPSGRLKLREIAGAPSELVWYRRVETGERRDCDYELSRHDDASELKRVLACALGVKARVAKKREVYGLGRTKINLDEVVGLGCFIEFEAEVVAQVSAEAEERVRDLTKRFGLAPEDVVLVSYSDLLPGASP